MAPAAETSRAGNGKHSAGIFQNPDPFRQTAGSETTPLLSAATKLPFDHRADSADETLRDDELEEQEIDPNEFDRMLSRAATFTSSLGIEPESQESSMLRGPRRYSRRGSRRLSSVSVRGGHVAGPGGFEEPLLEEIPEESEDKSPFLGGISVRRFWLIYAGLLSNLVIPLSMRLPLLSANSSCQFVACFDMTILASSHPVITSYFHGSNSASWLSTAFLLTSTAFQPLFGRISDTMGRKPPYIFTLTVFLLATVWCALAQSMTEFIIARAFCGLGAGGLSPRSKPRPAAKVNRGIGYGQHNHE